LAAACAFAGASASHAQSNYPTRPVRIILPFGAGGVADVTSRLVAEKLTERLGQRFVIENQPGAGGITAARSALAAPADGYTLALLTNGTAISVPLFKSLPFDPLKDFVPISSIGTFECVFVVNAGAEFRTLADFIKAARDKPGALNVATITVGGTQNLAAELFKSMADVNFVIVPFRTSPDAIVALLRNDVQMVVEFFAAVKPTLADGKIRALATTGPQRSEYLPDAPTAQQAGVAGYDVTSWNAIYAPAGTPAEAVETLNKALRDVLTDAALRKRALEFGIDLKASSPAEINARMRADIEKWGRVIERAGIPKQ
jgi:tripartite-type tricarboxylate transporter receptor subunit TctC